MFPGAYRKKDNKDETSTPKTFHNKPSSNAVMFTSSAVKMLSKNGNYLNLYLKTHISNEMSFSFHYKGQVHVVKKSVRKGSWFELSRMTTNEVLMQVYMWVWETFRPLASKPYLVK